MFVVYRSDSLDSQADDKSEDGCKLCLVPFDFDAAKCSCKLSSEEGNVVRTPVFVQVETKQIVLCMNE